MAKHWWKEDGMNVRKKNNNFEYLRPKKNTCVAANMPKKIRVGRSENLFIFYLNFVC